MRFRDQDFFAILDYLLGCLCLTLVIFDFEELIGSCFITLTSQTQNPDYQKLKEKMEFYKKNLQEFAEKNTKTVKTNNVDNHNDMTLSDSHYDINPRYNLTPPETHSTLPQNLNFKPYMIPLNWLTQKEANFLGYKKKLNHTTVLQKIRTNEPIIEFTLATISRDKRNCRNNTILRLEGPFLRLRIFLYSIILVSCAQTPLLVALLCLSLEVAFILYVFVTACRFKHLSNWLSIWSRVNISFSIIILNFISLTTLLLTDKQSVRVQSTPIMLQIAGVFIVVFCILLEGLYLVVSLLVALVKVIRKQFCTKKKNKKEEQSRKKKFFF